MAGVVYNIFSRIMEDWLELKHHMISIGLRILFHKNVNCKGLAFSSLLTKTSVRSRALKLHIVSRHPY